MQYLRRIVEDGGRRRYGERPAPGEDLSLRARAWATIDHELAIIEQLGFAGYFLVVWDLVEFCRRADILCQGRGSAANRAVCYALGITEADAVSLGLLFERFLSPERDGPPDIDIDIESDRREEVIQYVYAKHGRHHTAQVANVITYRAKSAVRDMAKALGYAPGQQDAWTKQIDGWGTVSSTAKQPEHGIPRPVIDLALQVEDAPRHLGIHSGGMVICDRPVIEVCPVEWGRMDERSVLQWDKDDCAAAGLVKFDLLGLGMLSALHYAIDLIREHRGYEVDLATIPQEDEVYAMLCRADTVGVFQIESRAQMATLPRLRPRKFYDLVVEVALIRPGPIQGGSVHPYIRRRNGQEPVTYLHPLLENSLGKTLGVPLFQEQLMQMAIDVAGFTPAEADELRQAMGSKRSAARMERLRERLYDGMAERRDHRRRRRRAVREDEGVRQLRLPRERTRCRSPTSSTPRRGSSTTSRRRSARRCSTPSRWASGARTPSCATPAATVSSCARPISTPRRPAQRSSHPSVESSDCGRARNRAPDTRMDQAEQPAVRLGIESVRGVGEELAKAIQAEQPSTGRTATSRTSCGGCPRSTSASSRRWPPAGCSASASGWRGARRCGRSAPSPSRGPTAWRASSLARRRRACPGMSPVEEAVADLWATGVSPDGHPTVFLRDQLDAAGVVTAQGLWDVPPGSRVTVAGVVTHRQRPMTAQGTTFLNLEDETGLINVVVSKGCWARFRRVAREAPAMMIRGRLERSEGVINLVAEHLEPLTLPGSTIHASRDFR